MTNNHKEKHMEVSPKQNADSLIPPRKSSVIEALIKSRSTDHPIYKKYIEEYEIYEKNLLNNLESRPKQELIELPELNPIDLDSFYDVFKSGFEKFNNKTFDENANSGEPRKLAKTLCAYFAQRRAFLRSPLLNDKSEPSLDKGLLIIGTYGTGKTSIMRTFDELFRYAVSNPLGVADKHGVNQFLARYKFSFRYLTAIDVVKDFESISDPSEKEYFWNSHKKGVRYYDDVMSESTASNFGKIELFKDILEMRYQEKARTMISLNYIGNSVGETLTGISKKYGERVYDRIFEMFNIIELKGETLRK